MTEEKELTCIDCKIHLGWIDLTKICFVYLRCKNCATLKQYCKKCSVEL